MIRTARLPDYPNYLFYSNGTILGNKRLKRPKNLKPWVDKYGYQRVHLTNKNGRKGFGVAALILSAFVSKPTKKHTVNHKNGIKTDNRLENLEWATQAEQIKHAFDTGLKLGYEQGKLKPADVRAIRLSLARGVTLNALGIKYGVHLTTIGKIKSGKNWSHIKDI